MEESNPGEPVRALERVVLGLFNKARQKNRKMMYLVGRAAYKIESDGVGVRVTKIDKNGSYQISLPVSGTDELGGNSLKPFVEAASDIEMAVLIDSNEWAALYEQH